MDWLLKTVEYDGLPLYLRRPNYKNIWEYQNLYPNLIGLTHTFESVADKGLPTSDYNKTLFDFDSEIIELFQKENIGIIILIETFGGARTYWFYGKDSNSFLNIFDKLKTKHSDKELELDIQNDVNWNFIKDYPEELY